MPLPNIAFLGKAGAGKTTAADYLVKHHGYKQRSFAAPLKDIADYIWGEPGRTDRDKLQKLGVAVREIDPDAWVNLLRQSMAALGDPVVVDDLRFPNELWALKAEGFVTVRVLAEAPTRVTRLIANGKLQDRKQLDHLSETALDDQVSDVAIPNDDDIEDLEHVVLGILNREAART